MAEQRMGYSNAAVVLLEKIAFGKHASLSQKNSHRSTIGRTTSSASYASDARVCLSACIIPMPGSNPVLISEIVTWLAKHAYKKFSIACPGLTALWGLFVNGDVRG